MEDRGYAVCYDAGDGLQVEFRGTESECQQYIEKVSYEQFAIYGDESPERFIQRF